MVLMMFRNFVCPNKEALKRKLGRPQPIWKIAYAGAVGGQSLTGIPSIEALKEKVDGIALWPFEVPLAPFDWDALDDVKVVATEIYPSMVDVKALSSEIKDEAQVRIIAEYFAKLDENSKLAELFTGPKEASENEKSVISGEEGWILGV